MNPKLMQEAVLLSREMMLQGQGGPFGAVISRGEVIIGRGWNSVTSTNDPTAHAEVMAIRDACRRTGTFRLEDCQIYCSCEPCPMCLGAVYWARLDALYYAATREDAAAAGFDDDLIYREIGRAPIERQLLTRQLMRTEALAVLAEWGRQPDRIPY